MKIHIVKKGESLYGIAQKYHIELDKLIAANPQIADPNVIDVGTKVKIPHDPKPVTPPTDYLYKHTVIQGDSLWKLGKAWGIPLTAMISANPQLKNPNVLMTGEIVYIPKLHAGTNVSHHPKKDTSQIAPEAPLPVEAAPISELPETPMVETMEKPVMPAAPIEEKPVAPIAEKPMMPMEHMMPSPQAMEMPIMPSFPNFPHMELPQMKTPDAAVPYTAMEAVHPFSVNEGAHPAYMYPNWGKMESDHHLDFFGEQHPSHHLFQQYEVPAVQALAHEHHISTGDKGKQNVWAEPEYPTMPVMPQAAEMPYYEPNMGHPMIHGVEHHAPHMPQAAEMPYYEPNAGHPMIHGVEQPMLGGDCGCGQPKLPYAVQMPSFQLSSVQPNVPFLAPAHMYHQHMMPMMPYAVGPNYQHVQPMAAGGYPGAPFHPGFGVPMGSTGVAFPWTGHEDHQSPGKGKSRGDDEKAVIARIQDDAPAAKAPKKKSKSSSTHAAISRLIERNRRKARDSYRTRRASPWLSQ